MKQLKEYLNEGLLSRKISTKTPIRYSPKTREELIDIIIDLLKNGQTNFNCIDVSEIDDMSYLFCDITYKTKIPITDIDISEWDVSNVTNMEHMFADSDEFTADLSKWNVHMVTNMDGMFHGCEKFNSDLSNWDVSNVSDMYEMFWRCRNFNSDLSNWNVSNVKNMFRMFVMCEKFNSDLSKWDVTNVKHMRYMFDKCETLEKNNKIPAWYKPRL